LSGRSATKATAVQKQSAAHGSSGGGGVLLVLSKRRKSTDLVGAAAIGVPPFPLAAQAALIVAKDAPRELLV
jgi:hypothetical protein